MVGRLDPGRYLCISVSDTGVGMTAEVLARAFEPFFTTKSMGNGTGLGLSIVHSIVTGHGGAVQVVSKPRKGTVVSVFFPEVERAVKSVGTQAQDAAGGESTGANQADPGAAKTHEEAIAIVDDEESIAVLTKQAIDSYGFRGFAFTSAQACLDHIAANPGTISLVITDQIMPRISGTDLVKKLRALDVAIPAIIVSGITRPVSAQELKQLSPVSFLSKPFPFTELVNTIHKLLP
jgi:CheY-like chemotaxis protein